VLDLAKDENGERGVVTTVSFIIRYELASHDGGIGFFLVSIPLCGLSWFSFGAFLAGV